MMSAVCRACLFLPSFVPNVVADPSFVAALQPSSVSIAPVAEAYASTVDVRENLARLTSTDGNERWRAQRWLTANVSIERDLALVAAAARRGDAEVRGRIEAALSDDDRHLALAVELAADESMAVSEVGRTAIAEMFERWSPGSKRTGKIGPSVFKAMRDAFAASRADRERPIEIDESFATRPLEDVLALLARFAPRAPELAIDPTAANASALSTPNAARKDKALAGPFDRVLQKLLASRGLECEGFGLGDDKPNGATTWLCAVSRGRDSARNAAEIVVNWCVASRQPGDERLRSDAARALAATTWPAANAWLARRWIDARDLAALDGLALAALRSGVAPMLADPHEQLELRRVLETSLAQSERSRARASTKNDATSKVDVAASDIESEDARRASSIANLLGATGVCGTHGEDLALLALDGADKLAGRALWLRLVELEGRRSRASAVVVALDAWIAREDLEPVLRFQALRVRRIAGFEASSDHENTANTREKATAPTSAPIANLDRIVEWATNTHNLDELANILRARPGSAPETWRDPTALPASWNGLTRAIVVEAWLVRGDLDVAASHLAALAQNSDARTREDAWTRLRNFDDGDVDRILEVSFARALAREGADVAHLLRGAAIAGAADSDELSKRAFDALDITSTPNVEDTGRDESKPGTTADSSVATSIPTREDLLALAALTAGPRAKRARAALVQASTGKAAADDRIDALDRAVSEVRSLRDRVLEQTFLREIRAAARDGDPTWRSKVRVDLWPAPPPIDPLRLADFDRSFARAGI